MCQCDLSSHLSPHLSFGCHPPFAASQRGFSPGRVPRAGLCSGGDSEELSLGMVRWQVPRVRGRRGDGVRGSPWVLLPALPADNAALRREITLLSPAAMPFMPQQQDSNVSAEEGALCAAQPREPKHPLLIPSRQSRPSPGTHKPRGGSSGAAGSPSHAGAAAMN